MGYNMKRRLEKMESKAALIKTEYERKEAKLSELKSLEKDNSIEAMLLRLELETGQKYCIADIMALAQTS